MYLKPWRRQCDWVLTINGTALKESSTPRNVSLIFYLSVNGENATLSLPSLSHKEKHTYKRELRWTEQEEVVVFVVPSVATTEGGLFTVILALRFDFPAEKDGSYPSYAWSRFYPSEM